MKKLIISLALLLFPILVFADNNYRDVVSDVVGVQKEEGKINIYLFYSATCPHCHEEMEFLNEYKNENKNVNIYEYEVTQNETNFSYLEQVKTHFNVLSNSVPFTVIGDSFFVGFSDYTKERMINVVNDYQGKDSANTYKLPILGEVDAVGANIFIIAIILGFIDGFNPCAMWVLLLLIGMVLSSKNKKKMFFIGGTFIFASALVYFLSMLGIGIVLDLSTVAFIRSIIGALAVGFGIYNLYTYIKTRKDTGCHVVDKKKRKNIINKINDILSKQSFILMIIGTIALAISVNLIELMCSLGFPAIFLEILSVNKITGIEKVLYMLLYIFFYMIDDLTIFLIALKTSEVKGISTKYGKLVNLIGGILMLLLGVLLIIKPEWVMFNF